LLCLIRARKQPADNQLNTLQRLNGVEAEHSIYVIVADAYNLIGQSPFARGLLPGTPNMNKDLARRIPKVIKDIKDTGGNNVEWSVHK
jgi:hypothetical protein